eukprot:scaffold131268_cov32-Tisochrysis_lutea.AAC.2
MAAKNRMNLELRSRPQGWMSESRRLLSLETPRLQPTGPWPPLPLFYPSTPDRRRLFWETEPTGDGTNEPSRVAERELSFVPEDKFGRGVLKRERERERERERGRDQRADALRKGLAVHLSRVVHGRGGPARDLERSTRPARTGPAADMVKEGEREKRERAGREGDDERGEERGGDEGEGGGRGRGSTREDGALGRARKPLPPVTLRTPCLLGPSFRAGACRVLF